MPAATIRLRPVDRVWRTNLAFFVVVLVLPFILGGHDWMMLSLLIHMLLSSSSINQGDISVKQPLL